MRNEFEINNLDEELEPAAVIDSLDEAEEDFTEGDFEDDDILSEDALDYADSLDDVEDLGWDD